MNMPALLGLLADLVAREIEVQSLTDRLRTSDPGVSATLMLAEPLPHPDQCRPPIGAVVARPR